MHVYLLLGPHWKDLPTLFLSFHFSEGANRNRKESMFLKLKNTFLIPKAICIVYLKNQGDQFPSISYGRTDCGWNSLVAKKSYSLREEVVTFNMPERVGAGPFFPSKPQAEPPHRAIHTCNEPFFWLRMLFWFIFSQAQIQHPGRKREIGPIIGHSMEPGGSLSILHPTSNMSHWGDLDLITWDMLLPLDLSFLKVSFGKNAIKISVVLSKWPYEEGKTPSLLLLPHHCPGTILIENPSELWPGSIKPTLS